MAYKRCRAAALAAAAVMTMFAATAARKPARAPEPQNVPELLKTSMGSTVSTKEDWENVRAPEILEWFTTYEYGRRPAEAEDRSRVSFETVGVCDAFGGKAIRKLVKIKYAGPEGNHEFTATAYIPKTAKPAPAFVTVLLSVQHGWTKRAADGSLSSRFWAAEEIVSRGYATVGFANTDVAADDNVGFSQGIFKAVQKESERDAESWATISAWAWAASRVMDWIETEPLIDAKHVGVVGHSRGGKTALWAGATDRRFALVCSNDSGCSGAKLNHIRLPGSESITRITDVFPYWFCGNYRQYRGREMEMDADQHWLLALIAPRALCVASATQDNWAGPLGEWWSAKLASPAWKLYGKKGLAAREFPKKQAVQQDGGISYHIREGGHMLAPYDWERYMDFADKNGFRDAYTGTKDLTVDFMKEPGNVGRKCVFSWKMDALRKGAKQTAWRIRVNKAGGEEAWDSGEKEGADSIAVPYGGKPLQSATHYEWSVSVKDEKGEWTPPAVGRFTTGLAGAEDWNGALWISVPGAREADRGERREMVSAEGTSCFVKETANAKAVKEAFWTVAGLGAFEAYVNGRPVARKTSGGGEAADFLKPGFTHFKKTKHSFTYDVTPLMKTEAGAKNVFSAQVSSGWWRDRIVNYAGKRSAFRAVLLLRYADGTEERVATGTDWLCALAGPVKRAGIFDGEEYDARVGTPWMTDASAAAGFKNAEENTEFKGETIPMDGPSISLRRDLALAPVLAYAWKGVEGADKDRFGKVKTARKFKAGGAMKLEPGETLVVDFGQNAAAVPEFAFSAAAGVRLKARPAEMLNDGMGAKARRCDGPEGSAYFANYRGARTAVDYTFAGNGVERYLPRFTFFGYRYLSITATGPVKIESLRSIPVTSIEKGSETGRLETGVADVNKLVKNVLWGQYSNYLSVPTDCPQRNERLGWTADTQVFTGAAFYNANVYGFLKKWMKDMRDSQRGDGCYPGVAPDGMFGGSSSRFGWADAGVIVPHTMWKRTGDRRVIDENWDSMKKFLLFVAKNKYADAAAQGYQWADWLSYEKYESHRDDAWTSDSKGRRPHDETRLYWRYLGACHVLYDAILMAEMAEATGRGAESAECIKIAGEMREYIRENFLDKADGMLLKQFRDMQTPAIFALRLGIVRGEAGRKTAFGLIENIDKHGGCLQTGFLGTAWIMDTVSGIGAVENAYSLLLQHKNPSWLYSVDQGATTIWERWNSYTKADGFGPAYMNSFNHYAYGSVLSWMYSAMAGISVEAEAKGGLRIVLAPKPDSRMKFVDAEFESLLGKVSSRWEYGKDGWTWHFTIPANATATVVAPGRRPKQYGSGSHTVKIAPWR